MLFFRYFLAANELDACLKWVVEAGDLHAALSPATGLLWGSKSCDIISGVRGNDFVISTQANLFGIRTKRGAYTSISHDDFGDEYE